MHGQNFDFLLWHISNQELGPRLNKMAVFPKYEYSHVKGKTVTNRSVFNIGIPILVRRHLYIETPPGLLSNIYVKIYISAHGFWNFVT